MDATSQFQDSLPVSSDALLARMENWGIAYRLYEHAPLRTVEDAKVVQQQLLPDSPGAVHIKNLYVRDRKKRNYLITLEQDRAFDLKGFGKELGVGTLSFGSADRLMEHLGIRPGAVSPLAMVNGAGTGVAFYLDRAIQAASLVYLHPLVNDRSVALTPTALMQVMERFGVAPVWID